MPNSPIPRREWLIASAAALPVAGCATQGRGLPIERARMRVRGAERALAAPMARRDLNAFAAIVADDAVFINGGQGIARLHSSRQLQSLVLCRVAFDNGYAGCKR